MSKADQVRLLRESRFKNEPAPKPEVSSAADLSHKPTVYRMTKNGLIALLSMEEYASLHGEDVLSMWLGCLKRGSGSFDKKAYQREYMRGYRARKGKHVSGSD